jgi:hypothetical protein
VIYIYIYITYVCIHVHTYIHTHIHTYIRTYIHTYIRTYISANFFDNNYLAVIEFIWCQLFWLVKFSLFGVFRDIKNYCSVSSMGKALETTDLAIPLFEFSKLQLSNVGTLSGKVTLTQFNTMYWDFVKYHYWYRTAICGCMAACVDHILLWCT